MSFMDRNKLSGTSTREERRARLVRGTLRQANGTVIPILVRNLSERGLGINCKTKPPQRGETVLISGIGGGVATFGLAFAVAHAAKVYVTGESEDVLARARAMGALGGLLYTDPDWRKQVGKLTGGIDVVLDGAPAPSYANYVRAINPGARIVIYGSTAGDKFEVTATGIFLKSASIVGSQVGDPQDFRDMLAFVGAHDIKPVIEKTFTLDQSPDALLYLEGQHTFGKVVVTI